MAAPTPHSRSARWVASRRLAGLLAAGALLLGPLAGAAAAATTPRPAPGQVPGVESRGGAVVENGLSVFYQQVNQRLTMIEGTASGFGTPTDLGGVLTSGPAALEQQGPSEFVEETVFARGGDNAIWYRQFSDGLGEWLPWTRLGGRALGAPTVTCVGNGGPPPVVYVRGGDSALWRRPVNGVWTRIGGALASDPSALPAVAGSCPSREDVFALGTDSAVFERLAGAWHRLGGRSTVSPTAVQLLSGETDLFVRGTDYALWMNSRASGTTSWTGWHRVGGILSSAPAATIFPTNPQTRVVFALGADGNLWRGHNLVGSATWTWTQVP
jgi:hypothetical protein